MFSRKQLFQAVVAAVVISAWWPTYGSAQTFNSRSTNLTKAIKLHEDAVSLYPYPDRAWDAARLHIQEVKYRSPRDPEAVESLAMAAHLFGYAGQPGDAKRVMEQAADRALAIGEVNRAAQAYLQAAFFAQKATNKSETTRLVEKTLALASSPSVTASVRDGIRDRVFNSILAAK